jgi:hypothetical protein
MMGTTTGIMAEVGIMKVTGTAVAAGIVAGIKTTSATVAMIHTTVIVAETTMLGQVSTHVVTPATTTMKTMAATTTTATVVAGTMVVDTADIKTPPHNHLDRFPTQSGKDHILPAFLFYPFFYFIVPDLKS